MESKMKGGGGRRDKGSLQSHLITEWALSGDSRHTCF